MLSQSGIELGYGAEWVITSSTSSRTALVAYVEPGFAADIVFLDLAHINYVPLRNPLLQVVFAENGAAV